MAEERDWDGASWVSRLIEDWPPFTNFGQWGTDMLDLRVFDQDAVWVDRLGIPHPLERMTEDYRLNVLLHVSAMAPSFWAAYIALDARRRLRELALEGRLCEQAITDLTTSGEVGQMTPHEWLKATPLVKRLLDLANAPQAGTP